MPSLHNCEESGEHLAAGRAMVVHCLILTAAGLAFVFARLDWRSDLDWAINWGLGSTILIGPAAAGLSAWSVTSTLPKQAAGFYQTIRNGHLVALHVTLRTAIAGSIALLMCVAVAAVTALLQFDGALTSTALAVLNGPLTIAACSLFGATLAAIFRSIATAPLAAGAIYSIALVNSRTPVARVFWDGGATGSLDFLRLNPPVVIATAVSNTAICLMLAATIALVMRPRWTSGRRSIAVGVVGVAALISALGASWGQTYYSLAPERQQCITSTFEVCTIPSQLPATAAFDALSTAHSQLSAAGFPLFPERFTQVPEPDSTFILERVPDGELTQEEIAITLSSISPTCDVDPADAQDVAQASVDLAGWIGYTLGDPQAPTISDERLGPMAAWAPRAATAIWDCDIPSLEPAPS